MRKLIAAINMTLDGFCDHTAGITDDDILQHYNELLRNADTMLFGRITYQLMESYWPTIVTTPTGNRPTDEFAVLIDNISKIVYSRTLQKVAWENTTVKKEILKEEILALKEQPGTAIVAGSPSLIATLTKLGLVDEYQVTVHPLILGTGLPLFKGITDRIDLALRRSKPFACGAITLYYAPAHA
jgi:dihydrofolate reductase